MLKIVRRSMAGALLFAVLAVVAPVQPASANGAASTRNILLLGGAAATYLIIQHNRKVHEKYAQYDRQQAALSQQRNNAYAAYSQEQHAYDQEVAVNGELKKEIAYQHEVIGQQRHQLAALNVHRSFADTRVSQVPNPKGRGVRQVAMTSYGWGTI
ncbi:MAG TPA: hypothetical protein VMW12_06890 [Candidatus Dormibacteraeota bacterium]|nr:hypothetical protein [Candidatus Dormibacteraeota bacterium]